MKVLSVSDLHGLLIRLEKGAADVLTISGDICPVVGSHSPTRQLAWLESDFFPWCKQLIEFGAVKHIVFTPGNHDFACARKQPGVEKLLPPGVHMLIDSYVEIDGVKFYGTPWTPRFGNWAFMLEEEYLRDKFAMIPEGVDVLLSHGPAYGWCDVILEPKWAAPVVIGEEPDEHLGSKALRDEIRRAEPKFVLCGHIHTGSHSPLEIVRLVTNEDGSTDFVSCTKVVNVSLLDEEYHKSYEPFRFEV